MTYHFTSGAKKQKSKKRFWIILPVLGLLIGAYLLINVLAPMWEPLVTPNDTVAKKLVEAPKASPENRLYIPKINVDVAIVEGTSADVLEKGAWWRKPENGDPKSGGNFVLSAHRFNLGLTPQQTQAKSPFYHIDKLNTGDEIFVDFDSKRYAYKVTKRYSVDRNAIEIEQRSPESKLTLYSCDLRGEQAGREVIEAEPLKNIEPREDL